MENSGITKPSIVNAEKVEQKVKAMYTEVAENPHGEFHFEMGRNLALRLGYTTEELDAIPTESVDSFAGVGYHFGLANIQPGENVLDLGSGSGMDMFIALQKTGETGKVTGVDMTDAQLQKAESLASSMGYLNVSFVKSYIESLPFEDEYFDVVISNGVVNLSPDKEKVFLEICRVLKKGGRMAISDIITEKQMPDNITCNSTLWAACIGGAMQQDSYRDIIQKSGLQITQDKENLEYAFISESAEGATKDYGVKSASTLAQKT